MSSRKRRLRKIEKKLKQTISNKTLLLGPPDKVMVVIIASLIVFGIMAVFTAGAPEGADLYGNTTHFLVKHLIAIGVGLVALFLSLNIDYRKWQEWIKPLAFVVILLVAATLIPGLGKTSYGASRWLAGLPVQPSEFSKFITIILVSSAMVNNKELLNKEFLENAGMVLLMMVLVFMQPNLSIAIIIALISSSIMLVGGISVRLISILAATGIIALVIKIKPYQLARITGWLDPWSDPQNTGYNLIQSLYAIGSGGIFGVGYGNSRQKLFWLPFSHTDFIFAVIAEELGLIGCFIIIGLFVAFTYRGFYIANKCSNEFGRLLAFGITFAIAIQAFINIGVATGVLPVTGVTLPLVSHGGTSVVITLFMLGVLLNISRQRIRNLQGIRNKLN